MSSDLAKRKLHLGYRTARLLADDPLGVRGSLIRGHEFHYASLTCAGDDEPFAELADGEGRILERTGNLRRARCNLICMSFVGSLIFLIPIFYTNSLTVLTASLAAAFFCLELSIGPVWSVPMDIAPSHAGTASGIMNTGAAIAAIISPTVFGYVVELTGSWTAPFFASIGLLLVGAVATFFMRPDRTLDVGEIRESSDQLPVVGAPGTAIAG